MASGSKLLAPSRGDIGAKDGYIRFRASGFSKLVGPFFGPR